MKTTTAKVGYHGFLTTTASGQWWAKICWRESTPSGETHGETRFDVKTPISELPIEWYMSARYAVALRMTSVLPAVKIAALAERVGLSKRDLLQVANSAKWVKNPDLRPAFEKSSYEIGQEPFDRQYGDYEGKGDGDDETCNDTAGERELSLA